VIDPGFLLRDPVAGTQRTGGLVQRLQAGGAAPMTFEGGFEFTVASNARKAKAGRQDHGDTLRVRVGKAPAAPPKRPVKRVSPLSARNARCPSGTHRPLGLSVTPDSRSPDSRVVALGCLPEPVKVQ